MIGFFLVIGCELALAGALFFLAWHVHRSTLEVRALARALLEQAELHRRTLEKLTRTLK